ncbi:MAG: ECF-type sigma factor [Marinicellaceae bacterium]
MQSGEITVLLNQSNKDLAQIDKIYSLLYSEIKVIASQQLNLMYNNNTLNPTALAHECYIKLVNQENFNQKDRKHLLNYLAISMRRYIIDQIRGKNRDKRNAQIDNAGITQALGAKDVPFDLMDIDRHINNLSAIDQELSELFQQKLLFDFTFKELAEIYQLSERQVIRRWNKAKTIMLTLLETTDES